MSTRCQETAADREAAGSDLVSILEATFEQQVRSLMMAGGGVTLEQVDRLAPGLTRSLLGAVVPITRAAMAVGLRARIEDARRDLFLASAPYGSGRIAEGVDLALKCIDAEMKECPLG